jgi:RTX calcium-binding nonapeptide repeat (4 copies)
VACFEVLVARGTCKEGGCVIVRQGRLIAVVVTFLIGCAILLLIVGCSGRRSETSKKERGRPPQATESEEARCERTRTFKRDWGVFTTNDLPGCPDKGGPLSGTKGADRLSGKHGDDEVRGLGGSDELRGGSGNDVTYGGPGKDLLVGAGGKDVLYGGPGDDRIVTSGGWNDDRPDELYCGKGQDKYSASKDDHVSSSCEKKLKIQGGPM